MSSSKAQIAEQTAEIYTRLREALTVIVNPKGERPEPRSMTEEEMLARINRVLAAGSALGMLAGEFLGGNFTDEKVLAMAFALYGQALNEGLERGRELGQRMHAELATKALLERVSATERPN